VGSKTIRIELLVFTACHKVLEEW